MIMKIYNNIHIDIFSKDYQSLHPYNMLMLLNRLVSLTFCLRKNLEYFYLDLGGHFYYINIVDT